MPYAIIFRKSHVQYTYLLRKGMYGHTLVITGINCHPCHVTWLELNCRCDYTD